MMRRPLSRLLLPLLVASLILAGCMSREAEVRGDRRVAEGGTYDLSEETSRDVDRVEGNFELENKGDLQAQVTAEIRDPSGSVVATTERILSGGERERLRLEHDYTGSGPAGTYTLTLRVMSGEVEIDDGKLTIDV
ncbi:MAG TPA: hypothetical protein VNZ52_01515 [Candidatus Thermoplasmatota archaeon]|nr:hypothetical protein [Candidatus Thermoplasmatota archaeon]